MIVIGAAITGALMGAYQAKRRGGNNMDILQYAAGFAIAFGLLGMLITVVLLRTVA